MANISAYDQRLCKAPSLTPCKAELPLRDIQLQGKCKKKNQSKKVSINTRVKAIQIVGQRKGFFRQIIPEYTLAVRGKKLLTYTSS